MRNGGERLSFRIAAVVFSIRPIRLRLRTKQIRLPDDTQEECNATLRPSRNGNFYQTIDKIYP